MLFLLCLKGFLIGALGAMPLGPSAFLTIRRTLNRKARPGFMTGIGISVSDMFYATLAALGVNLVMRWLEDPAVKESISLAGCVILAVFGLSTMLKNPFSKDVNGVSPDTRSLKYYIGSGFCIAIANPTVIFFYLALFAAFAFTPGTIDTAWFYFAMLSVWAGDLCWWLLLTFVINKVRNKFDLKQIRTINIWFGALLLASAVAWLIYTLKNAGI